MFQGFEEHLLAFVVPLLLGNLLHLMAIRLHLFKAWAKPISSRWFGESKTYRGFVLLTVLTGLSSLFVAILIDQNAFTWFWVGCVLGLTYALGELPNSFIKRRLNVKSGEVGRRVLLQRMMDKMDSLILLIPVYYVISDISIVQLILLLLFSFGLHLFVSFIVWKIGLKKNF